MRKKHCAVKVMIYLIYLLMNLNLSAEIIEINNFKSLQNKVIESVSNDSLVLFDVDDVLISPTDEFDFRSSIRKNLKKNISKSNNKKEVKTIFSDFFLKRQVKLVNNNMPELIKFLKENNIPTSALSAWWTDDFGTIKEMETKRLKELEQVNISFIDISPFTKDIRFTDHKTEHGTPMVISGIILTAFKDKGEVLGLALKNTDLKFKKIIFIDDKMKFLKEVESLCQNNGSEFIGIHYTESSFSPVPALNIDRERTRFNILEEKHIWLSDKEIDAIL